MHNLVQYLSARANGVKNIVFAMERMDSVSSALDLCAMLNIEHLYIVTSDTECFRKTKTELQRADRMGTISFPNLRKFDYRAAVETLKGESIDVLLFDSDVKAENMLQLSVLCPNYLVGRIWYDEVPYFELWETYRASSSHIYIQCLEGSESSEFIDWERDDSCDIELSIIFPVYNVAKYLEECITSVTKWQAPYAEFLFVNDGSPDNSRDIILDYQGRDPRIKLIDKPNGGCASARQKGLEQASGRYVGFVDPDDFVDENMFKKLFSRVLLGSYEVCYCGYNEYYENTKNVKKINDSIFAPYSSGIYKEDHIRPLMMYTRTAIWRGIYQTEFLRNNQIGFQESIRRFDDLPFKIEVFAKAKSVVSVPEHLYYYRLERPGQDVACDDERLYVHFQIFDYLNEIIGRIADRRLIDILQVCKIQTHGFAAEKIQAQFLKEYCKKARQDLKTNGMSFWRSLVVINKYIGKKNALIYTAFFFRSVLFFKVKRHRKESTARKNAVNAQETCQKLESFFSSDK